MGQRLGKMIEFVGQWTNDRQVEAKGRVEQKVAPNQPVDEIPDAAVAEEEASVRREHGDVTDGAPRNP